MNIRINKTLCPMHSFQFCECVLTYKVAVDKYWFSILCFAFLLSFFVLAMALTFVWVCVLFITNCILISPLLNFL